MIKVLHLYYDLLNLYGENANSKALIKRLENQNIKVMVDFKSVKDKINFDEYDFIYVGSGSLESMEIAKEDFKRLKKDIKKYIDDNKFILATGNSLELFDSILDYKTKQIDFRIVGDQVFESNNINKLVIGFQNRTSVIYDNKENTLFKVKNGTGFNPESLDEGIRHNNFFGTYLLGPILIRNPYLLEYIVKELLESKNMKYEKLSSGISFKAYDEFLKNFVYEK